MTSLNLAAVLCLQLVGSQVMIILLLCDVNYSVV